MKKNYLQKNISLVQPKKGKTDDDGEISDGHISIKDYLIYEKIWDKFKMKNMGDYHDHYNINIKINVIPNGLEKYIFDLKSIKQEPMKLIKYHYHALMIKDMSQMMEFILWLIFIKIAIIEKRL